MSWFKWISGSQKTSEKDDEASLEWRNKYLMARAGYLKTKIENRGGYVGSIENDRSGPLKRNQDLQALVNKLEAQWKALRKP